MILLQKLRWLLLSVLMISAVQSSISQAGVKLYAGLISGVNRDANITADGQLHNGYVAGLDGRLNSDRMYFLIGGQYRKFDLLSEAGFNPFGDQKIDFFSGRIGLGFDMIKITPKMFITSKVLGTLHFANEYDNKILPVGYETVNDGTAGLIGGLGVRWRALNVDVEYEYGLFNSFKTKKEAIYDFISLTCGVSF